MSGITGPSNNSVDEANDNGVKVVSKPETLNDSGANSLLDTSQSSVGTPKRRRISGLRSLRSGEQNKQVVGRVVMMQDKAQKNDVGKIREVILCNDGQYCHMSAWNEARDSFAKATGTIFLASDANKSIADKFNSIIDKVIILKNVSIVDRDKEPFNMGNASFAIRFTKYSEVTFADTGLAVTGCSHDYLTYLATERFATEEIVLDDESSEKSPVIVKTINEKGKIVSVDIIRFRYKCDVVHAVVDAKLERANGEIISLTAWGYCAFFLHHVCKKYMGRTIIIQDIFRNEEMKLLFTVSSKLNVLPMCNVPKAHSLKQLIGVTGAVSGGIRLLIVSDFSACVSRYGMFVADAVDSDFKCQLYTAHWSELAEDDEITVKYMIVYWIGDVLAIAVTDKKDIVKHAVPEHTINKEIDVDGLTYPQII